MQLVGPYLRKPCRLDLETGQERQEFQVIAKNFRLINLHRFRWKWWRRMYMYLRGKIPRDKILRISMVAAKTAQ